MPTLPRLVALLWCTSSLLVSTSSCIISVNSPGSADQTAAGEAGELRATIFEPELRYRDERIFASIVLNRPSKDNEVVEARLQGPGAPDEALPLSESCMSVDWTAGEGYNSKVLRSDDGCSFRLPREGAEAGEYRIVVSSQGQTIGEHAFSLVAVPGMGQGGGLIVEPAGRVGKAYMRDLTMMVWLPIDASYEWRQVFVFLVQKGEPQNLESPAIRRLLPSRLLKSGDAAVHLGLVSIGFDARKQLGSWQAVAFVGNQRIGSWSLEVDKEQLDETSSRVRGFGAEQIGPYAKLAPAEVSPALDAQLREAANALMAKKERSYGKKRTVYRYRKRIEPRICAVLADEKAAQAAQDLEKLRREATGGTHGDTYTNVGSVSIGGGSVGVSVHSGGGTIIEGPPLWDTGTPPPGVANSLDTLRNRKKDKEYAAKLRRFDAMSARHRKGCFAKVTSGLSWLLPEPTPEEPEWVPPPKPRIR